MTEYSKTNLLKLAQDKQYAKMGAHLSLEDQQLILTKAQQLKENIFTFDKPWDMERCTTPYQLETLDFNAQKNDDEEWCFMLNRMDYLNYLILADIIEQDHTNANQAKRFILEWIHQHPSIHPEPSTRTLDTGIRLMNIFECLPYLYAEHIIDDDQLEMIVGSMQAQLQYLKHQFLNRYITSNWGSIQTCAIVSILPYFDEDYQQNPLFIWAYKEMIRQFNVQVYDDGMHWEQSTMYHIEVLNYGMKALHYLSPFKEDLDTSFKNNVFALAKAVFLQATPSFEIETFGDTDRCNIQDVMTRAAALFKNKEFKWMGFPSFDLESLYTLGVTQLEQYLDLEACKPVELYFDGNSSGMYCVRNNWSNNANFTMFTNGSLGSGHGHSDNLHVSIYHQGKPILIDCGRLTYREDHPMRIFLKSMKAHNSVIVDDHEYCTPCDSWGYSNFGTPLKSYVNHKDGIHYYEGTILGNHPLSAWTRKMIVIDQGIWVIVDTMHQDGHHALTSRFHLDPSVNYQDQHVGTLKFYTQESVHIEQGVCSLRYNEPLNHKIICVEKGFTDHTNLLYSFYDEKIQIEPAQVFQDQAEADENIAFAKKFVLSESESFTVVIFNQEVYKGKKILFSQDVPFHAKAVVIHEHNGEKELVRLRT